MGDLHRTAKGKMFDMGAMRAKNELVRAVGNMQVNARGDTIDNQGNIINDRNKRVNERYMKGVASRGSSRSVLVQQPGQPQPSTEADQQSQPLMPAADETPELTAEELAFEQEDQQLEMPVKEEAVKTEKKTGSSKKD
jgi:hypothetical protein